MPLTRPPSSPLSLANMVGFSLHNSPSSSIQSDEEETIGTGKRSHSSEKSTTSFVAITSQYIVA